jgi:hypothetical protein
MVGVKAGPINTGVHTEIPTFLNTSWRSGLSAGAFLAIDASQGLVVRANLLFSQRGFGFRMYDERTGLIPGEAELRSVELLMDFGLRLPWPGRWASTRLFAGPAVGYEVSCKVEGSVVGVQFNEDCDQPALGLQIRTIDMGFSVGGGLDIYLQPFTVVLDGLYTHGLRNLNEGSGTSQGLKSRTWGFTVGLGWSF